MIKKKYETPRADVQLIECTDIVCGNSITLPFVPFDEAEDEDC